MLDCVAAYATENNYSVFTCALKVVTVAELSVTGDTVPDSWYGIMECRTKAHRTKAHEDISPQG